MNVVNKRTLQAVQNGEKIAELLYQLLAAVGAGKLPIWWFALNLETPHGSLLLQGRAADSILEEPATKEETGINGQAAERIVLELFSVAGIELEKVNVLSYTMLAIRADGGRAGSGSFIKIDDQWQTAPLVIGDMQVYLLQVG